MSYATIEEANKILLDDSWSLLTDVEKQSFLDIATIKIDSVMNYESYYISEEQETVFPLTTQTKVPKRIILACIYEAGKTAEGVQDEIIVQATDNVSSESTATASISYNSKLNTNKYLYLNIFNSKIAIDYVYLFVEKGGTYGITGTFEGGLYGTC